jgi:hypothetical protein
VQPPDPLCGGAFWCKALPAFILITLHVIYRSLRLGLADKSRCFAVEPEARQLLRGTETCCILVSFLLRPSFLPRRRRVAAFTRGGE